MLELINTIVSSSKPLTYSIQFLICGSEELGLHGSHKFVDDLDLVGEAINLESLGSFRPFAFITHTKNSSNVVRAMSKVRGSIICTVFTDIYHTPLVKSYSDIDVYEKVGVAGLQGVFFGNPTYCHTVMGNSTRLVDIDYVGNILTDFIRRYQPESSKGKDAIGFGISPFTAVIEKNTYKIMVMTLVVPAIIPIVLTNKLLLIMKCFMKSISLIIFVFICYFAMAFVLYQFNTLSYANSYIINFMILCCYGISALFLAGFANITDNDRLVASTLIESIILLFASNFDISIIFFLGLIS